MRGRRGRSWVPAALLGAGLLLLSGSRPTAAQTLEQRTDFRAGITFPGRLDGSGGTLVYPSSGDPLAGNPDRAFQVFRVDIGTGVTTQLTPGPGGGALSATISDDGQRIAFVSDGDPTGGNHDRGLEVFVMARDGSGLRQLTSASLGSSTGAVVTGDGLAVLFGSTADLTGGNPDLSRELFLVDWDGTNLRQVTDSSGDAEQAHVSDDGQRIVFSSTADLTGGNPDLGRELFAILADGTGLRQLTGSALSTTASQSPWISGDGTRVAFQSNADLTGGNPDGEDEVFVIGWDGTGLAQLTNSKQTLGGDAVSASPSMDDAAGVVVFHSNQVSGFQNLDANYEIWKIGTNGLGLTPLTSSAVELGAFAPAISGDGSRVAFLASEDPGGTNPDGNLELFTVLTSGAGMTQHTSTVWGFNGATGLSSDGSTIAFASSSDLTGGNPERNAELFAVDRDGGNLRQLTQTGLGAADRPSVTAGGAWIAFDSTADYLAGGNLDASREIWVIGSGGAGLTQLTSALLQDSREAAISGNGAWIAFRSEADLLGTNPENNAEIFAVRRDGSGMIQLTQATLGTSERPSISSDGLRVAFESSADLVPGGNPEFNREIYTIGIDGTGLLQLTASALGGNHRPSLRGDGLWVAFESDADLVGTNGDGNTELYRIATDGTGLAQLTNTTSGNSGDPAFSEDGTTITFVSSAPFAGPNPDGIADLWRIAADGSALRRLTAARAGAAGAGAPSTDGSLVAFTALGDLVGTNPDRSPETFLVDLTATWTLRAVTAQPTRLAWGAVAGARVYDVARGNLDALSATAGAVDLGPLHCVENDSPDLDTAGFDDADLPTPGSAFFYVVRPIDGLTPPGYGTGSAGNPRTPGPGDCPL